MKVHFAASSNLMSLILEAIEKKNVDAVLVEKFQFLAFSNGAEKFTPSSFQMPQVPHSCRSSIKKYVRIQSFIPIAGLLTTL